ncbi:type IX secretion system anionic LPS delivery protein PorZ [Membranihabitans marinus]|uniref:type IX secretion system anionic LPS delivery protein PorZ n=1 Tax=Membranihabitans marinus TaxID=1227546 RepID=UPI001F277778|nr:hypothetical protein [Membranihabitans marinus]
MIRYTRYLLLLIVLGFSCSFKLYGQENSFYGLGDWKSYFPAKGYFEISKGENSIIATNPYQVTLYYPEDGEEQTLNKVNGLSDIGISTSTYVDDIKTLIIGYENGNIDIVTEDRVVNLNGIKNNANIIESKRINDIVSSGNFAFLATSFGVVQIDLLAHEFGSTLFSQSSILDLEVNGDNGSLVAVSADDLYQYSLILDQNFADIANWTVYPLGLVNPIDEMVVWKNQIYTLSDGVVMKWDENQAVLIGSGIPVIRPIKKLVPEVNSLLLINDFDNVLEWDGNQLVQTFNPCLSGLEDIIFQGEGGFYYVVDEGIGQYKDGDCHFQSIDGLPSLFLSEMSVFNGSLYGATGGVNQIYNNLFREDGFFTNESGEWQLYGRNTVAELEERDMRDIICVAVDGETEEVYFGSFWDGVVVYKDGEIKVFDEENSSLQNSVFHPGRTRVSDIFIDDSKNIWMANHYAPRPIVVYTSDGNWHSFPSPVETNIEGLVVDGQGFVWMDVRNLGIVIVDLGDWNTDADDKYRLILPNSSDATLFDNAQINELTVDLDGVVWVGTQSGPVRFDCGSVALESICAGRKPIIEIDDVPGILLGDENIRAIAIDPGNRKWFGTENGVYVINSNTDNIDHHFTTSNSPLPSNIVNDIAIDEESGEVYISTEGGLLSYRAEATKTKFVDRKKAVVYPNPVPPTFGGQIGIKELSNNALVRITSLDGRLIYERRAVGGQLAWDGLDRDGQQVKGGIYLVFATSDESLSPFTQVGKIFLLH